MFQLAARGRYRWIEKEKRSLLSCVEVGVNECRAAGFRRLMKGSENSHLTLNVQSVIWGVI